MFLNLKEISKQNIYILQTFFQKSDKNNTFLYIIDKFQEMVDNGYYIHRTNIFIPLGKDNTATLYSNRHLKQNTKNIIKGHSTQNDIEIFKNDSYVFATFGSSFGDYAYGKNTYQIINKQPDFFTIGDWIDFLPNKNIVSFDKLSKSAQEAVYFSILTGDLKNEYLAIRMYIELLSVIHKDFTIKDFIYDLKKIHSIDFAWEYFKLVTGKNIQAHFKNKIEAKLINGD